IATKILGSKCNRDSVKTAVAVVRYVEERQKRPYIYTDEPRNKREKKAIDRLAKALHRLNMALNDAALPTSIAEAFDRQGMLARNKQLKGLATIKLDEASTQLRKARGHRAGGFSATGARYSGEANTWRKTPPAGRCALRRRKHRHVPVLPTVL